MGAGCSIAGNGPPRGVEKVTAMSQRATPRTRVSFPRTGTPLAGASGRPGGTWRGRNTHGPPGLDPHGHRRADHRELHGRRRRPRHRVRRLLGGVVRPLPPVRARVRAGSGAARRHHLRQGRHRGPGRDRPGVRHLVDPHRDGRARRCRPLRRARCPAGHRPRRPDRQVRALDMDDVRRRVAAEQGGTELPGLHAVGRVSRRGAAPRAAGPGGGAGRRRPQAGRRGRAATARARRPAAAPRRSPVRAGSPPRPGPRR